MSHIRSFDHVGVTVADLDAATQFFVALGLEIEGRTSSRASSSTPSSASGDPEPKS